MEFQQHQAIYLQIADYICEKILLKKWQPEEKIPSVREMAVMIEVNPNTVQRAYSFLQDQGIIYNKRGIGYFVADNAYAITKKFKKQDFIQNDLPYLIRTLELLDISLEDLETLYQQQHQ
jgi:DNA-binding transcriptional regulator YhcF (GntR family)